MSADDMRRAVEAYERDEHEQRQRSRFVDCADCWHHYDQHDATGACRQCTCRNWRAEVGS